jgi:hypothetical protein
VNYLFFLEVLLAMILAKLEGRGERVGMYFGVLN